LVRADGRNEALGFPGAQETLPMSLGCSGETCGGVHARASYIPFACEIEDAPEKHQDTVGRSASVALSSHFIDHSGEFVRS
jgi:hypothetical protein